jgi:dUTP pyrophosphatase
MEGGLNMMNVKVKRLYEDANLPQFKTVGSAGGDLTAYIEDGQPIVIKPKTTALIKTGIAVELPKGVEMQIRGRSGLALKHSIGLTNGVGTIDTDYRGEVGVMLYNGGSKQFTVNHGDRIAQAIFARYEQPTFTVTSELSETERGEGGYGSTGVKND